MTIVPLAEPVTIAHIATRAGEPAVSRRGSQLEKDIVPVIELMLLSKDQDEDCSIQTD
jgi:hypothetical protein